MIVHEQITTVPDYDPLRHFHFGEIKSNETDNINLWLGSQGACDVDVQKINLFIDFEQPNMWYHEDSLKNALLNEIRYTHILSICPYISEWRNKILNRSQYIPISYFLNTKYVPIKLEKRYDIIYTGNNQGLFGKFAEIMQPFNFKVVCGDVSINYQNKLNLISQSKITLVHNLIGIPAEAKTRIQSIDKYETNVIFQNLESKEHLPQIKTRPFEAAFCHSLILCLKDNYNVIEKFFEPNKEFIYFSIDSAKDQITEILANYEDFQQIIDRAYEKAMDLYTIRNILKFIKQ